MLDCARRKRICVRGEGECPCRIAGIGCKEGKQKRDMERGLFLPRNDIDIS